MIVVRSHEQSLNVRGRILASEKDDIKMISIRTEFIHGESYFVPEVYTSNFWLRISDGFKMDGGVEFWIKVLSIFKNSLDANSPSLKLIFVFDVKLQQFFFFFDQFGTLN